MVTFEELSELALALQAKFKEADGFLRGQERALKSYYDEDKTNLAGLIENTAHLRHKMNGLFLFTSLPEKQLRTVSGLLNALQALFELGNAPLAYARMCKSITNLGGPAQDASDKIMSLWKKIRTLLSQYEEQLKRTFTRRHARRINAGIANPQLSGHLNIRILYHGLESIVHTTRTSRNITRSFEGLERVMDAIRTSGMSEDAYFETMTDMISLGSVMVLKRFPELFVRLQGSRLSLDIQVFVYPMQKGAIAFFARRFTRRAGRTAEYDPRFRLVRVWSGFEVLADLLARGINQGANGIASILVHELTHAFDKYFARKEDIYTLIRTEGLATFAAVIRQPSMLAWELHPMYMSRIHRWDSPIRFIDEMREKRKLAYTLGLVMCLGILFLHIKRRHNRIYTPLTDPSELIAALGDPALQTTIHDVHRMIHNMTTKIFFDTYQRAVAEGVAPQLFGEGFRFPE